MGDRRSTPDAAPSCAERGWGPQQGPWPTPCGRHPKQPWGCPAASPMGDTMSTLKSDEIRQAVRQRYADVAVSDGAGCGGAPSCCAAPTVSAQGLSQTMGYSAAEPASPRSGSHPRTRAGPSSGTGPLAPAWRTMWSRPRLRASSPDDRGPAADRLRGREETDAGSPERKAPRTERRGRCTTSQSGIPASTRPPHLPPGVEARQVAAIPGSGRRRRTQARSIPSFFIFSHRFLRVMPRCWAVSPIWKRCCRKAS